MLFPKRFSRTDNQIHIISLSCNSVPPRKYGGIELVIAHLCEGLEKLGLHVVCYAPGEIDIDGIQHFQTLPEPSPHIKEGGLPNTTEHLTNIAHGLLSESRPGDIILFNHPDHYRKLKKKLGLKFRLTRHLVEVAHWVDTGLPRNIIYPSKGLERELGKPGIVIPHGEKLLFRSPIDNHENHLFFAGRITKDKGIDIALAACKLLGITLVLAGPLNDRAFAETILADSAVKYLGELTYPELVSEYVKAKALVYMTQYTEPFGLSVIEAMAAGCPVITTGKGGTGETVIENETGFFCQTPEDIAAAYRKLDNINRNNCIARAKNYSIERMAESYLQYFESL